MYSTGSFCAGNNCMTNQYDKLEVMLKSVSNSLLLTYSLYYPCLLQ